jgi:hypothetical protein
MHDAVVLGVVIFPISPVDDERRPVDPLPSSTNASATRPEPAAGPTHFSIALVKGHSENILNSSHGVRRTTTKNVARDPFCSRPPSREAIGKESFLLGGRTRARTWDPLIKSQLLYQLSYAPGTDPESLRKRASFSKATPRCPANRQRFSRTRAPGPSWRNAAGFRRLFSMIRETKARDHSRSPPRPSWSGPRSSRSMPRSSQRCRQPSAPKRPPR